MDLVMSILAHLQLCQPYYFQSPYHTYFAQALQTPSTFSRLLPPLNEDLPISKPSPLSPMLLSPVETCQLLRLLRRVMEYAAITDEQMGEQLCGQVLQQIVVFYKIVFDEMPPYTVSEELQQACQLLFKCLVEMAGEESDLNALPGEYAQAIRRIVQL